MRKGGQGSFLRYWLEQTNAFDGSEPDPTQLKRSQSCPQGRGLRLSSQMALVVKNPTAKAGNIRDAGSILGSGRSPGGGHANPY